jgi:hypothetical protein
MESNAKGCEVVISGKLRAARAKSMKFTDGFMIHSGQPARDFVDEAVRHVMLRQGVLGIKVKMYVSLSSVPVRKGCSNVLISCYRMKGWDPEGQTGPKKPLPDVVTIAEPPVDKVFAEPTSEQRGPVEAAPPPAAPEDAGAYGAPAEGGYGDAYQDPQETSAF